MAPQRPEFALFVLLISFADFGHVQVCCLSSTTSPPPAPPPASDSCTAADNTPGLCVHLSKCQSFKSLFGGPKPLSSETISFLRRSVCGDPAKHNICCSTQEVEAQNNRIVNVDHLLPSPDSCGLDYAPIRQVLGSFFTTEINEYAWLALVEYRNSSGSISVGCGASLISKRYLITAGHCMLGEVKTELGTPINVILGEYDKKIGIDCVRYGDMSNCNDGAVVIAIEESITHPEYRPSQGIHNDLAIIRLAKDAPFSDSNSKPSPLSASYHAVIGDSIVSLAPDGNSWEFNIKRNTFLHIDFIRPICLPNSDISSESDIHTYVAGWGNSDVKEHNWISLMSLTSCQDAYVNSTTPGPLWDKQICAGDEVANSCPADSGGPFMDRSVSNSNVRWILYGVLSFRPTPCDTPAIFTKVFPYLNWIKTQIRE